MLLILCTADIYYFPTLLVTATFLRFCLTSTFYDIIDYVTTYPLDTIGYLGIYFALGTVWTYVKWNVYVMDYKKKHITLNLSPEEFVWNKLQDIYVWWMFWPLNIISSLLCDYLYRFFKFFFKHVLMKVFTRVVESAFDIKDVKDT